MNSHNLLVQHMSAKLQRRILNADALYKMLPSNYYTLLSHLTTAFSWCVGSTYTRCISHFLIPERTYERVEI